MRRATRIRLYPTAGEEQFLNGQFGAAARFVYNKALAAMSHQYRRHERKLSAKHDLKKLLPVAKRGRYSWLRDYDSMALQQSCINLDRAFGNFFSKFCTCTHERVAQSRPPGMRRPLCHSWLSPTWVPWGFRFAPALAGIGWICRGHVADRTPETVLRRVVEGLSSLSVRTAIAGPKRNPYWSMLGSRRDLRVDRIGEAPAVTDVLSTSRYVSPEDVSAPPVIQLYA